MERKDIIKELKRCLAYLMLGIMPVTTTACNKTSNESEIETFSLEDGANYVQIQKELEKYVEFDEIPYLGTFHKINKIYDSKGLARIMETQKEFDALVSLDEFANITGNTDVKYDSTIATIINNTHVDSKYQAWFANALDVLKVKKPDYCLAALNENFSKLSYKYTDNAKYPVFYDVFTGIVYVRNDVKDNDELLRRLMIEEVIGKGLTHAYKNVNGKKILYTTDSYYAHIDPMVLDRHIYTAGEAASAGFAKEIAAIALNEKVDCNSTNSEYAYIFKSLRKRLGISDEEYMNTGWEGIKNALYNSGYGSLYDTLLKYDMNYEGIIMFSDDAVYFVNAPLFVNKASNKELFERMQNEFIYKDYQSGKTYDEALKGFEDSVKGPLSEFDLCNDKTGSTTTPCVYSIPAIDLLMRKVYIEIPELYNIESDFYKTR